MKKCQECGSENIKSNNSYIEAGEYGVEAVAFICQDCGHSKIISGHVISASLTEALAEVTFEFSPNTPELALLNFRQATINHLTAMNLAALDYFRGIRTWRP